MNSGKSVTSPLVSIIMPLYNKRPYVRRAINSVRQQTFEDWELIVVDDSSTDGSVDEIPRNDSRIRVLRQKNAGPAAARNYGIKMAQGRLVTFLDADDYYYAKKLEIGVTYILEEEIAEWMMSAFDHEKGNEVSIRRLHDIYGNEIKGRPFLFNNALRQLTVKGWHINGLFMHKRLLERIQGFNVNLRCYEVTELLIRCALVKPQVLIYPYPLFRIVDLPDSAFKQKLNRIESARTYGESLCKLSEEYPAFSDILKPRGKENLLNYAASLVHIGKSSEARRYLRNEYPYSRSRKWWKLLTVSHIPNWLLKFYFNNKFNSDIIN